MFKRKRLPEHLVNRHAAFDAQVDQLEAARRALLSCLPVGRVDPAPIGVGLDLLDETLADIAAQLATWRCAEVEEVWQGCRDAIAESRSNVEAAHRVSAETAELEELLGVMEDVDEPLGHAFGAAERRFRSLRRHV